MNFKEAQVGLHRSWFWIGWAAMAFVGWLASAGMAVAAGKPATVAEIALYQGPDRGKILIDGAKKEGQLTFYNSHTWFRSMGKEFEKKYPFVKVSVWRSGNRKIIKRVSEEHRAGRSLVDIVETTFSSMALLNKLGVFQEYYSPELKHYADSAMLKGRTGVYYWGDRETYISLGFNTRLVPLAEAPKTYKDLLDPRWKGKMSIAGTSTGVRWLGNVVDAMGTEFIDKLSRQEVKVQNISGAALAGLVVSGEVPLSPTIYDANIFKARQKGAPVEWRPLEPVVANVGYSGISTKAPHPHAAILFLDFLHSKEGQQLMMKGGLISPRKDVGSLKQKFKKTYLEARYPLDQYEKKFSEWEKLMRRSFIGKR